MTIVHEIEPGVFVPFLGGRVMKGEVPVVVAMGSLNKRSDTALAELGLYRAVPFVAPEDKRIVGVPSYIREGGNVHEIYDVEEIPAPPPPPTAEEKALAAGLTIDDIDALVAGALARQGQA